MMRQSVHINLHTQANYALLNLSLGEPGIMTEKFLNESDTMPNTVMNKMVLVQRY